jgi:hypothetical protein
MQVAEYKLLRRRVVLEILILSCHKMKPLSSNRELYEYLFSLAALLKKRKFEELSEAVAFASRRISDMSAEFLGEARIALRRVLKEEDGILTVQERNDLSDVLRQLDDALDKR